MKMYWVVLRGHNARVLQHNLNPGSVLELVRLGPRNRLPQRSADVAGVIELHRRSRGKVGGENPRDSQLMGLQNGDVVGEHEGDVVDAGSESGPIGPLAPPFSEIGRALVEPKAHSEEEAVVHLLRHLGLSWASEFAAEGRHGVGVIVGWEWGHYWLNAARSFRTRGGFVLEDGRGGGVVEGSILGRLVCTRRHVVPGRGLVPADEDVGGLAGAEHQHGGGEGLHVGGIGADHRELVVGDPEEKRLIECSVDDSEKIGFAGVYRNNGGACNALPVIMSK